MRYQVISVSVYGGTIRYEFDNKHEALCKVRELKDHAEIRWLIYLNRQKN